MSEAEYAELRQSIRENGLREPITLHRSGSILDGRHRDRACEELGVPVRTETFAGDDSEALAFVLDLNLVRRHLNESQRAMIAADLATMRQGARTDLASIEAMSQSDAADRLNVSRTSTQRAVIVRDMAIPEIADAVRQGHMPVSQAAQVAQLPVPRQRQVAAEMHNGKSLTTLVLAATRSERVEVIERAAQHAPLSALGRTFPVIYADPPWHFEAYSEGGQQKAPAMQYPTMSVADICALEVSKIVARDAVLFMWAVPAVFPDALEVVEAWGFSFKTFAVRVKRNIACGLWFRGQHDPLICATRGSMPPPPEQHSSVFFDDVKIGRHSEKPDAVRDWISQAYPAAGKIELFARTAAPGWVAWGNQAPVAALSASHEQN
jgi:N6-adenosine-specific RNA methylase IME4/ParB-like chromosome segregation protein Spo0J